MASFEVELRSDVRDDGDSDDAYDGQVIVRSRSQTVPNPLCVGRLGGGAIGESPAPAQAPRPAPALQDAARILMQNTACTKIQRAVRRYNRRKRGYFVPIDDVIVGDADWCIVFEKGQDSNRQALAKCLLARYGLVVTQSVARGDDSRNTERRKVFMRIHALREALRDES